MVCFSPSVFILPLLFLHDIFLSIITASVPPPSSNPSSSVVSVSLLHFIFPTLIFSATLSSLQPPRLPQIESWALPAHYSRSAKREEAQEKCIPPLSPWCCGGCSGDNSETTSISISRATDTTPPPLDAPDRLSLLTIFSGGGGKPGRENEDGGRRMRRDNLKPSMLHFPSSRRTTTSHRRGLGHSGVCAFMGGGGAIFSVHEKI